MINNTYKFECKYSIDHSNEKDDWILEHVPSDDFDWVLYNDQEYVGVRFRHEFDLVAFKIRFGL